MALQSKSRVHRARGSPKKIRASCKPLSQARKDGMMGPGELNNKSKQARLSLLGLPQATHRGVWATNFACRKCVASIAQTRPKDGGVGRGASE